MARFILDEDMPRSTAGALEGLGHQVKDVRDLGLRGGRDEEIYLLAQREHAAVLTGDRGFGNIKRFPLGQH
jgi:predicted nuclease of predicted toxin-antitoxin system